MSRNVINTDNFIKRAKQIHGDRFDYSQSICKQGRDFVEIICPVHGVFTQQAREHLRGNGCIKCRAKRIGLLRKISTDEFIRKCNIVHNHQYDYSECVYNGAKYNVVIICKKHGRFIINATNHVHGQGCKYCRLESIRKSGQAFIQQAVKVHGQKYDYSLTRYVNSRSSISIICPDHGLFHQHAQSHLKGAGCRKCSNNSPLTDNEFVDKIKAIYGDIYDYSNTKYINAGTKAVIKCNKHGNFYQLPGNVLNGHGCPSCGMEKRANMLRKDKQIFIQEASLIHSGKYDYSLLDYINSKSKVSIICPDHGVFEQDANSHLRGSGCPRCTRSKGEELVENILNSLGVQYKRQKKYTQLKRLRYDFYLPDHNLCIEYNGHQHYIPIDYFGGLNAFVHRLKLDNMKKWFCVLNGINFLQIPYWEKDIENTLKDKLGINNI